MTIKGFEKKYDINFDSCFAYDAILRLSQKLKEIKEDKKEEFINDFMNLSVKIKKTYAEMPTNEHYQFN